MFGLLENLCNRAAVGNLTAACDYVKSVLPTNAEIKELSSLSFAARLKRKKNYTIMVEAQIDGEYKAIGAVDLFEFNPQNRRAGVGIIISSEFRQKGYALDALQAVERYAREVLMLNQLWCSVAEDNIPSLRLFERAQYERCGLRRDWILSADGAVGEVLFQKIL